MRWTKFFIDLVELVSTLSEDDSTKVGAVIVRPDKTIVSMGYNGAPRGVPNETVNQPRPTKYFFAEHAERNAIYNALRVGASVAGCTLWVSWLPCADCARAIIQSGISKVMVIDREVPESWNASCNAALYMFDAAGVEIQWV